MRGRRADAPFARSLADESSVVFTDVTAAAGLLHARNVSGRPEDKQFLLEEMGCGAAFFDYDNDGWLDIFLVNADTLDSGARASRPTCYLFHNNGDGTFTDVTAKAGLTHSGWGQACCVGDYDNDGYDDLFVTYWGRNVLYHNNGDGTFTDVSEKAGVAGTADALGRRLRVSRLRPRWSSRSVRRQLREFRSGDGAASWPGGLLQLQRHPGAVRTAGVCRRDQSSVSQPRRRHVSRRLGSVRHRPPHRARRRWCSSAATGDPQARTGWARQRRISTTTAGRTSTSRATARPACCIATTTMGRFARSPCPRAPPSTKAAPPSPAWASASATTTPTAGSTSSAPTSRSR